jgi:CheY-like chemotaxis protein
VPGAELASGGVSFSRAEAAVSSQTFAGTAAGRGFLSPRALALGPMGESARAGPAEMTASARGDYFVGNLPVTGSEESAAAAFAYAGWVRLATGAPASEEAALAPGLGGMYLTSSSGTADNDTRDAFEAMLVSLLIANPLSLYPSPEKEPETLLLVESDEETRDAMTVMLFKEGYQVLAVATGRDAWNVLRSPFAPIDQVLLDVHLPDIDGVQLVQRLRETYPTLPVFTWGYGSASGEAAQLVELGVPYCPGGQAAELGQLIETVRTFLRGGFTGEG